MQHAERKKKLKLKENANSDPEMTAGRYWLTLISETLNMEICVCQAEKSSPSPMTAPIITICSNSMWSEECQQL